MSRRYKGAVISATAPTTTGGITGTAPGAWTIQQQFQAQGGSLWPSAPVGWMGSIVGTQTYYSVQTWQVLLDSSNNFWQYGTWTNTSGGVYGLYFAKFDSNGTFAGQAYIADGGCPAPTYNASCFTIAPDGNMYAFTTVQNKLVFMKFATTLSGTITKSSVFVTGYGTSYVPGIVSDSSSNIYVSGQANKVIGCCGTRDEAAVWKFNSSGTLQWRTYLYEGSGVTTRYDAPALTKDSSNNLYIGGSRYSGGYQLFYAKLNSSGAAQWYSSISVPVTSVTSSFVGAAISSTGNPTFSGYVGFTAGISAGYIAQVNSSGVVQWQKTASVAAVNQKFAGVAVDSSDNFYVIGRNSTTSLIIFKFNSSGVIQWQRSLTITGKVTDQPMYQAISVDNLGNYYIGSTANSIGGGSYGSVFLKLPTNGSGTGTTTVGSLSYVYAVYTATVADGTGTTSTPSTLSESPAGTTPTTSPSFGVASTTQTVAIA